jgi:hypothetical protein
MNPRINSSGERPFGRLNEQRMTHLLTESRAANAGQDSLDISFVSIYFQSL